MLNSKFPRWFFFVLVVLWLAPAAAPAQEAEVSLGSLVQELTRVNPDVEAAKARYEAALTRPSQEKALPDPRVSFGWMSESSLIPGRGLGEAPTANINVQLSQEFPYPGKRGLRAEAAAKEGESLRQMWTSSLRERVSSLKAAYYELVYSYQALDLLTENQQKLRDFSKIAEARYAAGAAMQQDLIRAATEVSILQNRIVALEQQKESLVAEINTLLNRPATAPLGRPVPAALQPLRSYDELLAAAKQSSPMLLGQGAMVQSRESGLELARKDAYPDFELMGGYYNQGKMPDMWEIRAGISLPVFFGSKQKQRANEAALQLAEARQTYRSAETTLEFRMRDAYIKAQAAWNLVDLYSKQVVPQSKLALESSLASYETGGVDFLTVLSNFTNVLEYRMNACEQQAAYLKELAVLEELAGAGVEVQS